jgi:hypothetical protein
MDKVTVSVPGLGIHRKYWEFRYINIKKLGKIAIDASYEISVVAFIHKQNIISVYVRKLFLGQLTLGFINVYYFLTLFKYKSKYNALSVNGFPSSNAWE